MESMTQKSSTSRSLSLQAKANAPSLTRALMKTLFVFSIAMLVAAATGCNDSGSAPLLTTGIQGQVYSIATPGPTPEGWVAPPLETISTIVVLNSNHKLIVEAPTDNKGRFTIGLDPGTYYIRVKESMIPAETGPYVVTAGALVSARAHFDNGMR
jgi:hypothetical protein